MGVDEFQGFLLARPMPQDDWLRQLGTVPPSSPI
jgi:EAL domain-containing protein (putative c-di-GMP-specific phosphodiesterase class I)